MGTMRELDSQVNVVKRRLADGEALTRLMKNKDFKRLFVNYYCKDQTIDLVNSKADPYLQSDVDQKYIDAQLLAVSHFSRFLSEVETNGKTASGALEDIEDEKLRLLDEGDE